MKRQPVHFVNRPYPPIDKLRKGEWHSVISGHQISIYYCKLLKIILTQAEDGKGEKCNS